MQRRGEQTCFLSQIEVQSDDAPLEVMEISRIIAVHSNPFFSNQLCGRDPNPFVEPV
jgi:hypothetical protein